MSESVLAKNVKGTYGTMYLVSDMQKSIHWYKNVLGLQPSHESDGWAEFPIPNHTICLHPIDPNTTEKATGLVIINVSNINNVAAELKKQGVRTDDVKEVAPGYCTAKVYDPDGNVVSLYEGQ